MDLSIQDGVLSPSALLPKDLMRLYGKLKVCWQACWAHVLKHAPASGLSLLHKLQANTSCPVQHGPFHLCSSSACIFCHILAVMAYQWPVLHNLLAAQASLTMLLPARFYMQHLRLVSCRNVRNRDLFALANAPPAEKLHLTALALGDNTNKPWLTNRWGFNACPAL